MNTIEKQRLISDPIKSTRKFYQSDLAVNEIGIDKKYLVRDINEKHKNDLKLQIKDQGLIEPITVVEEEDGKFTLLAGHHRLLALRELGATHVPAKVYIDLDETTRHLIGFMSNEVRKRPSAGNRFTALTDVYQQTSQELEPTLGKPPSEEQVIARLYYGTTKSRTSEITIGMVVDRLRNDPDSLVTQYDLIQNAQNPRKQIENSIQTGTYPLFTAQNVYSALTYLCRTSLVTTKEVDAGHDYRVQEYQNVRAFFDGVVTDFVQPWIEVNAIDTAVAFARLHPFEAFAKTVGLKLVEMGYPVQSNTAAPFYHDKQVDFDKVFAKLGRLKDKDFWTLNGIVDERAVNDLVRKILYWQENGKLPPF